MGCDAGFCHLVLRRLTGGATSRNILVAVVAVAVADEADAEEAATALTVEGGSGRFRFVAVDFGGLGVELDENEAPGLELGELFGEVLTLFATSVSTEKEDRGAEELMLVGQNGR